MPSDGDTITDLPITGRCYCGAHSLRIDAQATVVAYCHCSDCRRWTGAATPAFAAFPETAFVISPKSPTPVSHAKGVDRWFCPDCGSALAARFDYLPDQIYVPLGILDQAGDLAPQLHCHWDSRLAWLHSSDDLPIEANSARDALNARKDRQG